MPHVNVSQESRTHVILVNGEDPKILDAVLVWLYTPGHRRFDAMMNWPWWHSTPDGYIEACGEDFFRVLLIADKLMITDLHKHAISQISSYIRVAAIVITEYSRSRHASLERWIEWEKVVKGESSSHSTAGEAGSDTHLSSQASSEQTPVEQESEGEAQLRRYTEFRKLFDAKVGKCLDQILILPYNLKTECREVAVEVFTERSPFSRTDVKEILGVQQVQEFARADPNFGLAMAQKLAAMFGYGYDCGPEDCLYNDPHVEICQNNKKIKDWLWRMFKKA